MPEPLAGCLTDQGPSASEVYIPLSGKRAVQLNLQHKNKH